MLAAAVAPPAGRPGFVRIAVSILYQTINPMITARRKATTPITTPGIPPFSSFRSFIYIPPCFPPANIRIAPMIMLAIRTRADIGASVNTLLAVVLTFAAAAEHP
jgi:hypothetical protein